MLDFVWKVGSRVFLGLFVATALALSASAQSQTYQMWNTGADKVAISGYDTVAYFTESRAVKGRSEFEFVWKDARWHFSSPANRDLFAADPDRYAPQYGGFCSLGLAKGKTLAADPEAWTIVDGKLYFKFNIQARDKWRKNFAENLSKAEENWTKRAELPR